MPSFVICHTKPLNLRLCFDKNDDGNPVVLKDVCLPPPKARSRGGRQILKKLFNFFKKTFMTFDAYQIRFSSFMSAFDTGHFYPSAHMNEGVMGLV